MAWFAKSMKCAHRGAVAERKWRNNRKRQWRNGGETSVKAAGEGESEKRKAMASKYRRGRSAAMTAA
jgi:hypothetical protein